MKLNQVAAQLYTLRDHLKTPSQTAKTLRQVRKIGYTAVQVAGVGPIDARELAKMLDGEGLTCCSTHDSAILDSPETVAEQLATLGCVYSSYPYPAGVDFSSMRETRNLIKRLNAAGRALNAAGRVLTYHNHDIEFRHLKGRPVLDMIYDETDPNYVQAELDAHWVQAGGASTVAWCRHLSGRLPAIHLKDYAVGSNRSRLFAEVGSGNMDWTGILAAAQAAGCKWYIVEQDGDWVDNDPFKSLKQSFRFLKDRID